MKTLTIHQHWADAIFDHGKNVENRIWQTPHRGDLLIHAGYSKQSLEASKQFIKRLSNEVIKKPKFGFILGKVTLVNCVPYVVGDWDIPNQYHWILQNPVKCTPYPMSGKLSLWDFDETLLDWNYQQTS
ncbi:ASCH domain-containing protein [Crocosphaera sp.]|uniref:ASCH domain-containing protein n=1 Tax=Crocosphaera sp. TaxID=2729996 RepID=UPI002613CDD8|nr:ASCH domain-containing protein [Crocosphaera sp.]MDJ0579033.1 ASCH domain-containing protein [Crocosphaera sp.]